MPRTPPDNEYERKLLQNVDAYGWQSTSVSPPEGDTDLTRFTYTIGLHESYGSPELILFGLDSDVAHGILSIYAKRLRDASPIALDEPCLDLIEGFPCVFVPVPPHRFGEYVLSAIWYYGDQRFPLMQLVWPDAEGRFPWHADASPGLLVTQPVLGMQG